MRVSEEHAAAVEVNRPGEAAVPERTPFLHRRGWLVRRALLAADLFGLMAAFLVAELALPGAPHDRIHPAVEVGLFALSLPFFVVTAKLQGLYDHDEERTDHTTADDLVGVFYLVTTGTWLFFATVYLFNLASPSVERLLLFWAVSIALVAIFRAGARALCRRSVSYVQNTIIVGAGEIGVLLDRKIRQHPEYGLRVVGFVDDFGGRREDPEGVDLLGGPEDLESFVHLLDVERVIFAFSRQPDWSVLDVARHLRHLDVQIDVVPRLFDLIGPNAEIHSLEALPLVGLPPATPSRSSLWLKRAVDIVGASLGLLLTAPLFAYIAVRIKRDSPGPVFFRQTRLGMNMNEFEALKFRTMYIGTSDADHREYVRRAMNRTLTAEGNGLFKLEREGDITPFGRWLRKTSLDELPQLLNVLRGDMSLVGPRPCIPYEVESFESHHFDRFLVPAGITGLWQVTARAHSTFGEALDMDVAYARGWSLGLDLRLLLLTPYRVLAGGTR
jgi:exopolysaccharide biosynthesis polyprenyl glycosylphosphotransferase